jgi:anti-anti-sigma factor
VVEVHADVDGVLVVRTTRELCEAGLQPLVETLEAAVSIGECKICVDLSDVTSLSAAAIEVFLATATACHAGGGDFSFIGASGAAATALQLTGLDRLNDDGRRAGSAS